MHFLIYALGGGVGHLVRSVAFGRTAARRGHSVTIITNSPFAPALLSQPEWFRWTLHGRVSVRAVGAALSSESAGACLDQTLCETKPDVLIVDTFPRGLGGELVPRIPALRLPIVLVSRRLNDAYLRAKNVDDFVRHYDQVLLPGESGVASARCLSTAPWLICNADELADPEDARNSFDVTRPDHRLLVVQGTGRIEECEQSAELALMLRHRLAESERGSHAVVRFACLQNVAAQVDAMQVRIWPLMPILTGVDLLVAAGGYNTVYEARATATPLLATVRKRMYDTQQHRIRSEERAMDSPDGLWQQVQERLAADIARRPCRRSSQRLSTRINFANGTDTAVLAVERLVEGS